MATAFDLTNVDTQEEEQTRESIARSSGFLSWCARTSTAIPISSLLACRPLSCFTGSLNGTMSDTHLPRLTKLTEARIEALENLSKQCHLKVTIACSDELPFGAYSHPQVLVHIADRCTGRVLCPSQMTREAKYSTQSDHDAFEWQQALNFSIDLHIFLNTRTVMLFEVLEIKDTARESRSRKGKRFESVSIRDEDDEDQRLSNATSTLDYRSIAWGFFHTITTQGTPTVDSFVSPNNEKKKMEFCVNACGLRIRLFQYKKISWVDNYQAKLQWGWRRNHLTMPAVFLQYQKRSRIPALSTIYVQLRATNLTAISDVSEATRVLHNEDILDCDNLDSNDAHTDAKKKVEENETSTVLLNDEVSERKVAISETIPSEHFELVARCKRNTSELCLIPNRVLYSFPAGKKGCSAINFSPCGHFLAASVSSEVGYFVVLVYQLASAKLFGVGRGHRGIIYSLEWVLNSNGQHRLLSASSDSTVRLWELPLTTACSLYSGRTHVLTEVFQWQHFPTFVYCAIFLPESNGEIVLSGASDGYLRFRKEASVPNGQSEFGKVCVSSAAVHSICVEAKSQRIFCGDGKGDITVWRQSASATTLDDYERVKTVQTGQTSITSLKLHPRKAHLLVHTQPNAIFQYELRSYLLLNKSYADVVCESLLVKSTFSPDGKFVLSGSEDGVPRLYTSLYGQQVQRGVWGTRFFHDCPVLDVSWSPTAHMAALCSYGGNNPIVVLCANRDDEEAVSDDEFTSKTILNSQFGAGAFRNNQHDILSNDHAQRYQRALKRRRERHQAKLLLKADASKMLQQSN